MQDGTSAPYRHSNGAQTTVDHATSRRGWAVTGSSKVRHAGTKAPRTRFLRENSQHAGALFDTVID